MSPKPLCVLALLLVVLVGSSSSQRVDYSGYTEYDGRPAVLTLTFNGPVVTGNLHVSPVCEQGVHLTGVDIDLTGTATGPWENAATTVVGDWSGGDTDPCDASSTIRDNPLYPNNGTFTISMTKTNDGKDAVRLVRMPTGYGYLFGSKGSVYEGAGGTGSTDQGVDLKILELSVPSGIAPGKVAEILVTFSNDGGASSGPFNLYGYAFPNQNSQIYNSDPAAVQGLGAGETKSVTLSIPIPSNAPDVPYDIKVAVDNSNYAGSGDVLETNENNNEMWKRKVQGPEVSTSAQGKTGSTGSKVDLVVVSVRDDPNQRSAASDQLAFTMELKNLGTVEEKGFNVGFYLSPDRSITADDIYIGYGVVDLKPGESKSGPVSCKIPADIIPGLYYIGVIADPQEKVVESDETNNAKATEDPVRIPRSLAILSSGSDGAGSDLASGRPGSGSAVVHLQKGQTYTFQMPAAGFIKQENLESFSDAGINSISHDYEHDNKVLWGPTSVLSGDGTEIIGSGTTITLLAVDEGTATVQMRAIWEVSKSDGSVGTAIQDFSWTVIVGSFASDNDTDTMPGSFSGTVSKGEITSGKIKGKAIYRPTGEPVAGATILSLDFEDEARGSYPVQKLNSDGLKTGSDGTFEIDIATWMPSGVDPGTFWIRMIKFYDGPLAQDIFMTTDLDLWVIQSPLKTFTLTNESVQAGPIDVGIVMMDKACKVFGTECPYEPNWP